MPESRKKTRITRADEYTLAVQLAAGVPLTEIARRHGVSYEYTRKVSCGAAHPRVRQLVDAIGIANVAEARRIARASARPALQMIAKLARTCSHKPTRLRAAALIAELAGVAGPEDVDVGQRIDPRQISLAELFDLAARGRVVPRGLGSENGNGRHLVAKGETEHADSD